MIGNTNIESETTLFPDSDSLENYLQSYDFSFSSEKKENNSQNQKLFELTNKELLEIFQEINKEEEKSTSSFKHSFLHKKRHLKFRKIETIYNPERFIYYNQKKNSNKKEKISVLSYNILNQTCIKKNPTKDNGLFINERIEKIKTEILSLKPDIFCLQEGDLKVFNDYFKNDEKFKIYNISYGVNCGSSFINIIGYKKEKFTLKSLKNFSLINMDKNAGNRGLMNMDLENNSNGKIISVYNVHLPWKNQNNRFYMIKLLFDHIKEKLLLNSEYKNILIMGDFNSEPWTQVIKLFYHKHFLKEIQNSEYKEFFDKNLLKLCKFIGDFLNFNSAYQCYSKIKIHKGDYMRHPKFTNRSKHFKDTIDYIFFSNSFKIKKILRLPSDYEVDKDGFLPSKKYPSDHLKLFAELEMK